VGLSDGWIVTQLAPDLPGFWLLLSALISLGLCLIWGIIPKGARKVTLVARFVLLPYIGLLTGALSPHFMGLTGLDWLVGLSFGLGICFVILLALVFVRVTVALANPRNPNVGRVESKVAQIDNALPGNASQLNLSALIYQSCLSGAEEFHWAFLRGTLWEVLLTLPASLSSPIYWAVWASTLLASPELLLAGRNLLERLLKLVILVATSILFLYTRNFWLCWVLHVFAGLVLRFHQAPSLAIRARGIELQARPK
jgi:hypothetical protein